MRGPTSKTACTTASCLVRRPLSCRSSLPRHPAGSGARQPHEAWWQEGAGQAAHQMQGSPPAPAHIISRKERLRPLLRRVAALGSIRSCGRGIRLWRVHVAKVRKAKVAQRAGQLVLVPEARALLPGAGRQGPRAARQQQQGSKPVSECVGARGCCGWAHGPGKAAAEWRRGVAAHVPCGALPSARAARHAWCRVLQQPLSTSGRVPHRRAASPLHAQQWAHRQSVASAAPRRAAARWGPSARWRWGTGAHWAG